MTGTIFKGTISGK